MTGKGSQRRPQHVSDDVVAENWRRIFGTTEPQPHAAEPPLPAGAGPEDVFAWDETGGPPPIPMPTLTDFYVRVRP